MTIIEVLVCLLILALILGLTLVNFSGAFNTNLDPDIFETAVYAGLWKTDLTKVYIGNVCRVTDTRNVTLRRPSERFLSGLTIFPFAWANGGTYAGRFTVEPIMFKVGGR